MKLYIYIKCELLGCDVPVELELAWWSFKMASYKSPSAG